MTHFLLQLSKTYPWFRHIVIVGVVFLFALFIRVYLLSSVPAHLSWDEASIGYNAYSILESGIDETGKTFPLVFEAFGVQKLPGYIYLSVPFVKLFGLNELSVRLPSALFGALGVIH